MPAPRPRRGGRPWRMRCMPRAGRRATMSELTILSIAYPMALVGPDAGGGAEQILTALDDARVRAGHRSIVIGALVVRSAVARAVSA